MGSNVIKQHTCLSLSGSNKLLFFSYFPSILESVFGYHPPKKAFFCSFGTDILVAHNTPRKKVLQRLTNMANYKLSLRHFSAIFPLSTHKSRMNNKKAKTMRKDFIKWVSEWVSEWVLFNANSSIFSYIKFINVLAILWREKVNLQWYDDVVRFVLDHHAEVEFYSASSLKQQSRGRHVTPLRHIIPILSQPVFALFP
jgi:hypothetical protein